jgi:hypothetical protein
MRNERGKKAGAGLSCAEALHHVHHTGRHIESNVHFLIQQHDKNFEVFSQSSKLFNGAPLWAMLPRNPEIVLVDVLCGRSCG